MISRVHAIQAIALVVALARVNAFNPVARQSLPLRASALLQSITPKEGEKNLRKEISERNTLVDDEAKYSLRDGEGMRGAFVIDPPANDAAVTKESSFSVKMERLMRPRAYPLFLAEKAAEILESTVDGFLKDSSATPRPNGAKERIVVLGTGWGAASFLKDIDTSMYDVTVVSPRNYFLFTPMLAGSSVGTVEFRSITEPIREVRMIMSILSARNRQNLMIAFRSIDMSTSSRLPQRP
jgi:hypothetical protein